MMNNPHIDSYQFGKIVIDGKVHTKDVIILPDRVLANWWRDKGHQLQVADLNEVFAVNPDVLIVGMGASSRMKISQEVVIAAQSNGIELIPMPTEAACQEYTRRIVDNSVAAALHLTC